MIGLNKHIVAIALSSLLFSSCIGGDDDFNFQFTEISSILEAKVPDTMKVGGSYDIEITYQKNTPCHNFSSFEATNEGDSIYFVRAVTIFTEAANCPFDPEEITIETTYTNRIESDFKFRFLKDLDEDGQFIYIDKEVVVDGEVSQEE